MAEDRETAIAKEIVDRNLYLVLATSDTSGQPWASPVYFAHSGYREFFWISQPEATHSTNLRDRREFGAVIFDSTVPLETGQGVYIGGVAQEVPAHEAAEGVEIYSRRSIEQGGTPLSEEDVSPPAQHRLFRATAEAMYILDDHDHRVEVRL